MNLTAIIPTLNAAEFLAACLTSIRGVDRILIHDQGSTDRTIEIAKSFGCEILYQEGSFKTHGETHLRNEALDEAIDELEATHIMRIDADEILVDGALNTLRFLATTAECVVVPYWQLVGTANWSQYQNPVEHRGLIYKATPELEWVSCKEGNYHSTLAGFESQLRPSASADLVLIHLGYCARDLAARYKFINERGDWSDRDDVKKDTNERISKNPFAFLPTVRETPTILAQKSLTLTKLMAEHGRERIVTTQPVRDDEHKIIHINYGN